MKKGYTLFQKAGNSLTNLSTNAYLVAGALEGLDYLNKSDYSTTSQAIGAGLMGAGIYSLNKSGLVKKFSNAVNDSVRSLSGKVMPFVRTGIILPAFIAGSLYLNKGNFNEICEDFSNDSKKIENVVSPKEEKEYSIKFPKKTTHGRFERTYRWDEKIDEVEKKYNLEKGILAGLIMRESYGNPLELNLGNDGGAGLMMFQPGTGQAYGLKTYGDSNKMSRDVEHGKALKEIVKINKYDYEKLSKIDERFDANKSIEAAGKFLFDLKKRHGSWDKSLSAYNQGRPAPRPEKTNHVRAVREYQKYYNQRDID